MAAHPLRGLRQFLRGASCEALHRAQGRPDIQAHRDGTKSARNHSGADTGRASAHDSTAAYSRAAGAPSGALERSAVLERNFISKDFRRLALVVGIAFALLVVFGVVEGLVLK